MAVAASAAVAVGGCGVDADVDDAGDAGAANGHDGTAGTRDDDAFGGAGDGAAGGNDGRGGASGGAGSDDLAGAGGQEAGGLSEELERAALEALGDISPVSDEALIVGTGVVLRDDLCVDVDDEQGLPARNGLASLLVKRNAQGQLIAVTAVNGGALPMVDERPMRQVGQGFAVDDLTLCAHVDYNFENEYVTQLIKAKRAHLMFGEGETGLEVGVAVVDEDGSVRAASGVQDGNAPTVHLIDVSRIAAIDGISNDGFSRHFAFSEPIKLTSQVSLADAAGRAVAIQKVTSQGYWVGFEVQAVLSAEAELSLELEDLSGNRAAADTAAFPGIELNRVDPLFEAAPMPDDFYTSDLWNDGVGPLLCSAAGVYSSADGDLESSEAPPLTALAGDHSFYTAGCEVFFRVTRPDGATKLVLDARVIAEASSPPPPLATLRGWSLDGGGAPFVVTHEPSWAKDEAASTSGFFVSESRALSFALPSSGSDLMIGIQVSDKLWLDSLRFE